MPQSAVRRKGSVRTRLPCRKPGIHGIASAGKMHWRHGGNDVSGQRRTHAEVRLAVLRSSRTVDVLGESRLSLCVCFAATEPARCRGLGPVRLNVGIGLGSRLFDDPSIHEAVKKLMTSGFVSVDSRLFHPTARAGARVPAQRFSTHKSRDHAGTEDSDATASGVMRSLGSTSNNFPCSANEANSTRSACSRSLITASSEVAETTSAICRRPGSDSSGVTSNRAAERHRRASAAAIRIMAASMSMPVAQ